MVGGDQWPIFLYTDCMYDPKDAWIGLSHITILISIISCLSLCLWHHSQLIKLNMRVINVNEMEISCSETIGYSVIELVCSTTFNVLPVVDKINEMW